MARLTRSKIIPVGSDTDSTVEKWNIPDIRKAGASVVKLDDARKRSDSLRKSAAAHGQEANSAANAAATSEAAFEAGYNDGIRTANEQYSQRQQQLDYLLQILESPVRGLGEDVASELVSLSIEIARSVLNREIQQNPQEIIQFVASAMSQLPESGMAAQITVHPEDLQLIRKNAGKSLSDYQIEWRDDAGAARGSFKITQNSSVVHGGIEAMLATVLEQLHVDQS